jgi:hypothetical protein
MVHYKNQLFLTDLGNVSESIYKIGRDFRERSMESLKYKGNNPALYTKLFYFDYFSASRSGEPLLEPYPQVSIEIRKGWPYAHIKKLNLKHFVNPQYQCLHCPDLLPSHKAIVEHLKGQHPLASPQGAYKKIGDREEITQNILIETMPERLMIDYILDGQTSALPRTIDFSELGGYKARTKINHAMQAAFKADLTDGNTIYKETGITPHILRHLRIYDLAIIKGLDDYTIQSYLGWSSRDMIEEYLYIKRMRMDQVQLQRIDKRIDYLERTNIGKPRITTAEALF